MVVICVIGEYHLRLRQLEKSLLQALNDAKGKILDDDSVITSLETLKQEASEINKKVEETDKVIAEIETVSQQYMPLSQACSNIYFTLDSLSQVHFLYQYSLHFFLDIFHSVLYNNTRLKEVSDYGQRLSIVTSDLFQVVYCRVARGMLHIDRLTFAVLLCRIHLRGLYFILLHKLVSACEKGLSVSYREKAAAYISILPVEICDIIFEI